MTEYICVYDEDEMQYIPNPYEENTELIRCKNCIKRDLCCLYRDTKDENGFCKWAAQIKRKQ